ncbi:MAG TPA: lysophospholipid acyltransferase family protein [Steroidobacteraceae bacterium]|jgi:1-acyl-sn-glycerol-3-phosphate acyltransferase
MASPLKRALLGPLEIAYGLYAVAAFLVCGLLAFFLMLLPLGITARRHMAHFAAQAFFRLAGMPLRMLDAGQLPAGPCVVVANHASYLDGVVLKAALPARFSFVIKKEVSRVPLAGFLLRRIGSEFVDRFNRHAGGMDARRLIKAADAGQALAFFPEGTFLAQPGLGKFHTGAFAIAARAELPIVPIAIRGTRHILPSGRFLPRPGRIHIQVLPALGPLPGLDSTAAIAQTRDQSRARILAALDEPDLSESDGVAELQARRP